MYTPSLRVRFNWAYHDGKLSAEHNWTLPAQMPAITLIARAMGVQDFKRGMYTNNSTRAYMRYLLMNGVSFRNPNLFIRFSALMTTEGHR